MKTIIITATLILNAVIAFAQTTDTIKVLGNCDHCKERIETAALSVSGVSKADWNPDNQKLIVIYDASKANNDGIQQAIAKVGHDTEKYKAEDKVYHRLPACCSYTRASSPHEHHAKGIQTFEFKITGMTCPVGCAKGIENALYKQKGVKQSEVNYETQKAKVVYDPSKITKEQIISIVENFIPADAKEKDRKFTVIELE